MSEVEHLRVEGGTSPPHLRRLLSKVLVSNFLKASGALQDAPFEQLSRTCVNEVECINLMFSGVTPYRLLVSGACGVKACGVRACGVRASG